MEDYNDDDDDDDDGGGDDDDQQPMTSQKTLFILRCILLTKYIRTRWQNSELKENKMLQFSVKQNYICFIFI
jgi:hypothetical protein